MERNVSNRIEDKLSYRFEDRMDVGLIANELVSYWQEINVALRAILGQRGIAALYQRSLYLTAQTYPWLISSYDDTQSPIDLTHLKSLLLQQQATELILGGALMFKTFHELLVSLVGLSLTERLLHSVGAHLFSGSPAQDSL